MSKRKIASIVSGLGILITTITMVIHLEKVCCEHSLHPEWSFGVCNAVKVTAIEYGTVICIFAVILTVLNLVKKSK